MKTAPWKTATLQWHETSYGNNPAGLMPNHGQKVIACDWLGNMAVCNYTAPSQDFLLDITGIDSAEIYAACRHIVWSTINRAIAGHEISISDDEIDELIFEVTADDNFGEPVYFTDVSAWMELPPPPPLTHFELSCEDVLFKSYDVIAAIEPAIRKAVYEVMSK